MRGLTSESCTTQPAHCKAEPHSDARPKAVRISTSGRARIRTFSGTHPSKVDRSATYAARYAASDVIAAGLAERCEIQVAYAIGVARPTSITIETSGTGKVGEERLE